MDAWLISFWGEETNSFANSATANNGGGYSQPSGGMLVELENGEHITVTVDDMSCGEFGSRIFWSMECSDGREFGGCFGTMSDACIDEEWTDDSLASVSGIYGLNAWAMLADALDAVHFAASMN